MVGGYIHAPVQIKTMRRKSLDAGIEREVLAALFLRILDQPIKKRGAESAGAIGIMGDEIVDVKGTTGKEEIENAKTGHRTNPTLQFEKGELISLFLLIQHPRRKIDGFNVRTKLTHDGTTQADLFRRLREADS